MIFVDATYWPLVVIGPVSPTAGTEMRSGAGLIDGGAALVRLSSPEPRAIALVVPGRGAEAIRALDTLLAWLRDVDGRVLGPATRLAWVAPDGALRATLETTLADQGRRAFGRPASTFASMLPALMWLFEAFDGPRLRRAPALPDPRLPCQG